MRGERLDAEPLGGVVAGCDQVDPELLRGREARLLGLAREERVEALVRSPDQVVPRGARRDREALDPLGAPGEDERRPVDGVRHQAVSSPIERPSSAQASPTLPNGPSGLAPIRSASCAALPSAAWASRARW